mmetsp:Transcript_11653/g.18754  ORF Transcript_11653/g.18754 Transcript_11653/m.18754 type:complete len:240 (+) Transcript_11653:247-966(+)
MLRCALLVRIIAELLHRHCKTLLDLLLGKFPLDVVILLGDVRVSRKKHGAPHGEVYAYDYHRDANDRKSHVQDTFVGLDVRGGEESSHEDGGSQVTASANVPGSDAESAAGEEGYDTVRCSLGGLHTDGKENHKQNGDAERVLGERHENAQDALDRLETPQCPQPATHTEFNAGVVRNYPAYGAREEIHQAVARRQHSGSDDVELELVIKVSSHDVVHSELHPEGDAVGSDHAPHAVVG